MSGFHSSGLSQIYSPDLPLFQYRSNHKQTFHQVIAMDILILSELCSILKLSVLELNLEESFVQNGGHSLTAAAFVSACKARGCHITSKSVLTSTSIRELINSAQSSTKGRLEPAVSPMAEAPITALLQDSLKSISEPGNLQLQHHASFGNVAPSMGSSIVSLSENLQSSKTTHSLSTPLFASSPAARSVATSPSSVSSVDDQDTQEALTDMQLSLIHGSLKTPGMNIITYSETYYTKDISTLRMAWKTVIDTEPIFNSSAFNQFGRDSCERFLWHEESSVKDEEESRKIIETLRKVNQIGSSFHVFPRKPTPDGDSLSTITWVVHHAFVDGFSASLLFDKVRRKTAGMATNPSPPFSRLCSDLQKLRRSRSKEGNAYWAKRNEFGRLARSELLLPAITKDVIPALFNETIVDIKALQHGLQSISKKMNITSPSIFNAAWALLLSKYTDSNVVTFGVVLSGRDLPLAGVKETIGPLMNTLPLCLKIDPDLSATSFVCSVMESLTELGEFQWTTPENGFSNNFESALAVQFPQVEPPKNSIRPVGEAHAQQATEIPLSVMIEHDSKIRLVYHSQKYRKADMDRVGAFFYRTLQLLLRRDISIHNILQGIVPLSFRDMLFRYGNCLSDRTTRTSITPDLVTLFLQSVDRAPNSPAIERGDQILTYADLDYASSRLAQQLSKTVRPGDIVCVHSDRSVNWIVAIYGILKVAGTYCPLDSGLPPELRNTMFAKSGAQTFIIPHGKQRSFLPATCEHNIALDEVLNEPENTGHMFPSHTRESEPWSAAYLCFTSGSTGTPKGVICTHAGLVSFQSELEVRLHAQPGTRVSQVMSPAFDGSIHEIFSALSYGATLILPPQDDVFGHLGSVDSAILTPSMARVLDPEKYGRLSNVSSIISRCRFIIRFSQRFRYIWSANLSYNQ